MKTVKTEERLTTVSSETDTRHPASYDVAESIAAFNGFGAVGFILVGLVDFEVLFNHPVSHGLPIVPPGHFFGIMQKLNHERQAQLNHKSLILLAWQTF